MASKKATSKSSVASDAYIGPITRNHSKGITQEQDQGFVIAQSILKQLMESSKAGIVIKENLLFDNYDSASSKLKIEAYLDVIYVMMVDVTIEAVVAKMERKINLQMKVVEERDHKITTLREQMRTYETVESSQTPVVKASDKGKNAVQENQPQQQSAYIASLSLQQLQDMIANSIRAQYEGPPQTSFMYSKSYTKRIDNLKMSTRCTVNIMELTNTKQRKGEPVIDYINRWMALSIDCKDQLTELSAVEMYTQGMHWGLLYILQGIKPRTFEELATRAHDMELSIANRGAKDFSVPEVRKDKKETKDIADMLEQLLGKQLIQLSECKRPKQAEKINDPNYCKYHWVNSRPVENFFVLKELILRLAREKKIELDLEEEVTPEDSQGKERSVEENDEGNYKRGNKAQNNKNKKKTRKLKLVHKEDKDFPRPQSLVTLADFFPTRFLCDHQDENPEVVECHAINATKEESIPPRSLEEEGVSKDLSRFNVDDLLSLPQETKTILHC
ncbi:retrotransposon gag protein [Cucumis melo var. makuwa]|uniref:Retrotransposon gag protein n=1 Tax=Cucumis melo var. makuwa TaxID=1194695 RepID=A0A5D3E029_CUCMM|nr:retrotransposon gag protein [Cucumis melo var. makuwa]